MNSNLTARSVTIAGTLLLGFLALNVRLPVRPAFGQTAARKSAKQRLADYKYPGSTIKLDTLIKPHDTPLESSDTAVVGGIYETGAAYQKVCEFYMAKNPGLGSHVFVEHGIGTSTKTDFNGLVLADSRTGIQVSSYMHRTKEHVMGVTVSRGKSEQKTTIVVEVTPR